MFYWLIYFGAFLYRYSAMKAYSTLGIHTAMTGGMLPLTANVEAMVWKRMYEKLSPSPMPRCSPMPPLVFFDESDAPISVRMKEANDMAMRL